MKILYAIQGTGNGHICRAFDIVPLLSQQAEVDVLVSGIQCDIHFPFPITYRMNGLSFIFGKKGGIDILETYRKSRLKQLLREVRSLPVEIYDLVISDFEPVSAWACHFKNKPCVALSHQAAVLNKQAPHPRQSDPLGKAVLTIYAPASVHYGFHFARYADNIFTPVIRSEVRNAAVSNKGHYTVYLPAYSDDRIVRMLSRFPHVRWEVFSKHFNGEVDCDHIILRPIQNAAFISSMATSAGVLCGAGFETPSEALFMRKKLLVIPMKKQYEQHCNAAALKSLGVPVMKSLKPKHFHVLADWIDNGTTVEVNYPDETAEIIAAVLQRHAGEKEISMLPTGDAEEDITARSFRKRTLRHLLHKISN